MADTGRIPRSCSGVTTLLLLRSLTIALQKIPVSLTLQDACFSLQPPTDSHFQPSMSQGLRMGWWMHSLGIVMTYLFLAPHRFHLRPHSFPLPYAPCCSTNQSNGHLHVGGGSLQILCSRSVREHILYLHVRKETIRQLLLPIWTPGSSPFGNHSLFVCGISSSGRCIRSIYLHVPGCSVPLVYFTRIHRCFWPT